MTTSRLQQIEEILRRRGIGESHHRLALASKLAGHKRPFTTETVDRMAAHFTSMGKDPVSHIILEIQSGDWAATDADLADEQRAKRVEESDEKRGLSGMAYVTERNPYGWAQQEFHAANDHDNPGDWNAYRQCYNLTVDERRELGARDHRRRGCSRYEVLSHSPEAVGWRPGGEPGPSVAAGNVPRIEYDALEVSRAMGQDFGNPGASQGHSTGKPDDRIGRVYGE